MENCVIYHQLISRETAPFSVLETQTYENYDVCSKQTMGIYKEYDLSQPFASIILLFIVLAILFFMYLEDKKNG